MHSLRVKGCVNVLGFYKREGGKKEKDDNGQRPTSGDINLSFVKAKSMHLLYF